MSAALAASTPTPGSTAPELSLTTPVIDACANAAGAAATNHANTRYAAPGLRIDTLLRRDCGGERVAGCTKKRQNEVLDGGADFRSVFAGYQRVAPDARGDGSAPAPPGIPHAPGPGRAPRGVHRLRGDDRRRVGRDPRLTPHGGRNRGR